MVKQCLNYPLAPCECHRMNLKFSEMKMYKWIEIQSRTEEREEKSEVSLHFKFLQSYVHKDSISNKKRNKTNKLCFWKKYVNNLSHEI